MVLCFFSWFLGFFHMDSLRFSFNTWFPLNSQVKRFISFCIDQISQIPIQLLIMLEWLYCLIFFHFYWSIVAIQCYVSFCCTAKWISYCCLLLFSHSVMSDSATPWTTVRQASLSFTIYRSLLKLMFIESVMPSNHLVLCRPLLLLPSIFPSIGVFSNELALCIRWPKY